MAGKKKNASRPARNTNTGAKPASRGFDPHADGRIVIRKNYSFGWLFKEHEPNYWVYDPIRPRHMVGTVQEFKPMDVRSHVRIGFSSDKDIFFAVREGQPEKRAKKWMSGWIHLEELVQFKLFCYGEEPSGHWHVESCGIKRWESEDPPSITTDKVGYLNAMMTSPPGGAKQCGTDVCRHYGPKCAKNQGKPQSL